MEGNELRLIRNSLWSSSLSVTLSYELRTLCYSRTELAMRKTTLTRRPLWILALLVAAVTGGPVEDVKYWMQYGDTRLHKALTHKVNGKRN
jgi:hypothetical protein